MAAHNARVFGGLAVALVLLVGMGIGAFWWLSDRGVTPPVPGQQRCVATAGDHSVVLDLDQAHLASIIIGLSVRRGLPARAASIAMATVYQETGIRNLNYGDRDSVGLFQQRPSQGWGTVEQLTDPYYATDAFYDALVKIEDWQTDDINDVAQKVQRSGYPEAYRDHVADARVLASAMTGHSRAGFSCLERSGTGGDTAALTRSLRKTFGRIESDRSGKTLVIEAESTRRAWTYAHYAVANAKEYGVTTVTVAGRHWQTQDMTVPGWTESPTPGDNPRRVEITVR